MSETTRIAIVGLGGLFPGAGTPGELWKNVLARRDEAREPPPGRWLLDARTIHAPGEVRADRVPSIRACFLDPFRVEMDGLEIGEEVLHGLDPVFHLAVEVSRRAWLSARMEAVDRRRVGVILGAIALPTDKTSALTRHVLGRTLYEKVGRECPFLGEEWPDARNVHVTGLPALLVAEALGLGGRAFTLDAACASSLYAIKLAVDELVSGRADAMLAGGLSRPDSLYTQMGFAQLRALSPSGRCSPFDERGDGLVVGEGGGVFVLKRLEDARRDGDRVWGVIAGVGLSNDVEGGLLAPASEGQLRAMRAAYERAGWRPDEVDLIECHATGTPMGDAVEFTSLRRLWGEYRGEAGRCVLGAVKSTVGHLLTGAGAAAVTKVLYALAEQTLPPTANFARAAAGLEMEGSAFRVLRAAERWEWRGGRGRRAAVSGFGFGGINAHLLIEEGDSLDVSRIPARESAKRQARVAVVGVEWHVASSLDTPNRWWGVEQSTWFRGEGYAAPQGRYLQEVSLPLDRVRIPPREVEEMLPQQILMLDVASRVLAEANLAPEVRLRTGVYVGVGLDLNTTNFHLRWAVLRDDPALADAAGPPLTANRTMGALASIAASRIARAFGLGGPSFTVSSCDTSGLTALHLAVQGLRNHEIDVALVGEVDLAGDVRSVLSRDTEEPPCDGAVALLLRRANEGDVALDDVTAPTLRAYVEKRSRRTEGFFAVAADSARELTEALRRLDGWAREQNAEDADTLTRDWLVTHPLSSAALAVVLLPRDRAELLQLIAQARTHLRDHPDNPLTGRIFYTPKPLGPKAQVAFVYPGSGNDFVGMVRDFLRAWPHLAREPLSGSPELCERLIDQVVLGTLVTDVIVQVLGVEPHAAIGYSLGESSALFGLKAWRDRAGMLERLRASTLFVSDLTGRCDAARRAWGLRDDEAVDWRTGIVERSADEVREAMPGLDRVYLQIINTPRECVVGGQRDAVDELVRRLGCPLVPVPETTTMHCAVVRPVAEAYRELHRLPTTPPAGVRFYSAGVGGTYEVERESAAAAILRQASEALDFPAVIESAYRDGVRVFVEMGPGASCTRMIGAVLGERPYVARSACVGEGLTALWRVAAQLVVERVPVAIEGLYGRKESGEGRRVKVRVGGAPFAVVRARGASRGPKPEARAEGRTTPSARASGFEGPRAIAEAHAAFLRFDAALRQTFVDTVAFQGRLVEMLLRGDAIPAESTKRQVRIDRQGCLEFATGKIANVLGNDYAVIDTYPTRVRLPDEPLMLVDRILTIEGEPLSLTRGRVVTEHDVLPDAWYLDANRIPTCLAVEAGQADLFLSGYLGIDLHTHGLAVYRLLDAVVTFHRGLPVAGETIRYDIHIDHFFRQGETYLFRFRFEGTVNGEPLLTMTDGCAGFFSEQELAAGKGVVLTELQRRILPGVEPDDRDILPPIGIESYSEEQIDALREGDLAGCFGPLFANLPLTHPMRLPGGQMRLVHRVTRLDPRGGRFGIGSIRAEADIHPDDWFLRCHFIDDQVMPGTLMYECCLHTLRIFLLRLGWVGEHDVICEPVPGVASRLRCRGQVTAHTKVVTYEVILKERGYRPEPYVICDALTYADGKLLVEITDMSLRMTGLSREQIAGLFATTPLFDRHHILAFARGNPSEAFGEPYRPFDQERFLARLPGPPYCFLDRIVALDAEPFRMVAGGTVVAEYDVPPDEWYFASERSATIPFAVLLEIPLQVCGWMAAYIGSALTRPEALHFRNLGGDAELLRVVTPTTGTLTTQVKVTRVSSSAGMIVQSYDFETSDKEGLLYRGSTTFGFFSRAALAQQIGIRDANLHPPQAGQAFDYPRHPPYPDRMLGMLDRVTCFLPQGGPTSLGFIEGTKTVRPEEWFFAAHFYQDPVMPGSLGLEAFLQLLKVVAVERWRPSPHASFVANVCKHSWVYRGQVIPTNREVRVQAVVTAVDDDHQVIVADGHLRVDGLVIYGMKQFTLRLVEK